MNWPYDRSRRLVAGLDSVSVCMCVSLRVKGKSNYVGFVRPPTLSMLLYALRSTFCVKDFQGFVDIKWPQLCWDTNQHKAAYEGVENACNVAISTIPPNEILPQSARTCTRTSGKNNTKCNYSVASFFSYNFVSLPRRNS